MVVSKQHALPWSYKLASFPTKTPELDPFRALFQLRSQRASSQKGADSLFVEIFIVRIWLCGFSNRLIEDSHE